MKATGVRFGSFLEWLFAAAMIAAALLVGSAVLREFRTVRAVLPALAGEPTTPEPPPGVPPRAVSVPMVLLGGGKQVRLGDPVSELATLLGATATQIGAEAVDRTGAGERITRFYEHLGTRFVLVLEALEPNAEPQVAAIYLP